MFDCALLVTNTGPDAIARSANLMDFGIVVEVDFRPRFDKQHCQYVGIIGDSEISVYMDRSSIFVLKPWLDSREIEGGRVRQRKVSRDRRSIEVLTDNNKESKERSVIWVSNVAKGGCIVGARGSVSYKELRNVVKAYWDATECGNTKKR
jgi:hypothetical protein